MEQYLEKLEYILSEISHLEKKGLDTSSLKLFIKNYKTFIKLYNVSHKDYLTMSFEEKLLVIKSFFEDKKAFPRIKDIIIFANEKLYLDFKDQKESRATTIERIIGRIKSKPELKDRIKDAVYQMRNEKTHTISDKKSKKEMVTAEIFEKWAEIIRNI
ncbi:MAG: hypothetical protein CMF23_01600 [Ignavibacteriae bacterium]|nr:hypothetical protein [Ignavibacteriota bacterium]